MSDALPSSPNYFIPDAGGNAALSPHTGQPYIDLTPAPVDYATNPYANPARRAAPVAPVAPTAPATPALLDPKVREALAKLPKAFADPNSPANLDLANRMQQAEDYKKLVRLSLLNKLMPAQDPTTNPFIKQVPWAAAAAQNAQSGSNAIEQAASMLQLKALGQGNYNSLLSPNPFTASSGLPARVISTTPVAPR